MKEKGLKKQKEHINELIFAPNAPKVHQTKNKKGSFLSPKDQKSMHKLPPSVQKRSFFEKNIC